MQVKLERRYSDGFYLLNSIPWSRARDNPRPPRDRERRQPRQHADPTQVQHLGYNQPLNNTTTLIKEVPPAAGVVGNGCQAPADGRRRAGGMTAINTMTSSAPVICHARRPRLQVSGVPCSKVIGAYMRRRISRRPTGSTLPASSFSTDSSQPFGNAANETPRLYQRRPRHGRHKVFRLPGQSRLGSASVFNLFNRANYSAPNGVDRQPRSARSAAAPRPARPAAWWTSKRRQRPPA